MRAVVLNNDFANLDNAYVADLPVPQLVNSTDVLIKVHYASINPVDYKLAANHPHAWSYPYTIGLDLSGEVIATNNSCSLLKVGDRVAIHGNLLRGGALAEYVVHPEHVCYKIPVNISYELAAAAACAGLTAYSALVRKMNINANKTIFIQGGSGGVGSFAIMIAKKLGLFVISSCSDKNIAYVKELGADLVIDYKSQDVYDVLKSEFPNGIDYILETSNKTNLQKDLSILAFNGHIASIVGIIDNSKIQEFTTGFSFHEIALGGAYLSNHYGSQCDLAFMGEELMQLLSDRQSLINIVMYPLDEFRTAFVDLQTNQNNGKIVLRIAD